MPFQIVEERAKRPSFAQQIGQGVNQSIDAYNQYKGQQQQRKAIADRFGEEIANLPAELQKAAVTEQMKNEGRQNLFGQKQDYFSKLFGSQGQQSQQQNQNQLQGKRQQAHDQGIQQEQQFDASQIPDEAIAQASLVDPNLARSLQHAKDVSLRETRGEREFKQKNIQHGYEVNKSYIDQMTDAAQAADEMDMRLDQMLTLKDLPTPLMAATLETLGLPSSLFSADAETAEKLSVDLTKNIQQFYGNRILQSEFQAFLRSIPSLKNTPEGRKRIVKNMKAFNDLKRLEYNKMRQKEIEFEEQGKPLPASFRRQVMADMNKEAKKISEEFKSSVNYAKPLKRVKVKSGTVISPDIVDKYISDSKGDINAARKKAIEDGYALE